jgi:hypothetical protein
MVGILWAGEVSTPAGVMSTAGFTIVDIVGANIGVDPNAVSISYSGGSPGLARRTYEPPRNSCTIVISGARIRCATSPGVGTGYRFVVNVGDAASSPSVHTLSYGPPSLASVSGPGALLASAGGGSVIFLSGSNFGPVDGNTSLQAWAVPAADTTLMFSGVDCMVVEAHTTIQCTISDIMGASLTWMVVVEGQNNSLPISSAAAPSIYRVAFEAGVARALTSGGSPIHIEGINFGARADRTSVSITTPGGTSTATDCELVARDKALRCSLPPGVGVISFVSVSVLGQSCNATVTGLAYALPTVSTVSPSSWSTDVTVMTVRLKGSGFGSPSKSALVSVQARDAGVLRQCMSSEPVTMNGTSISVLSDQELTFSFRDAVLHVAAGWVLSLVVAGQALDITAASIFVPTVPPQRPTMMVSRQINPGHHVLVLTGANYGRAVSTCANDVTVLVDSQPCDELTMTQVRGFR